MIKNNNGVITDKYFKQMLIHYIGNDTRALQRDINKIIKIHKKIVLQHEIKIKKEYKGHISFWMKKYIRLAKKEADGIEWMKGYRRGKSDANLCV